MAKKKECKKGTHKMPSGRCMTGKKHPSPKRKSKSKY